MKICTIQSSFHIEGFTFDIRYNRNGNAVLWHDDDLLLEFTPSIPHHINNAVEAILKTLLADFYHLSHMNLDYERQAILLYLRNSFPQFN